MQKVWVLCSRCGSGADHAYFGAKSIGLGEVCPTCGSNWRDNQIIASTVSKFSSEILGDFSPVDKKTTVKVIWLST